MWGEADDEIARLSEVQDGIFTIADARSCDFANGRSTALGTSVVVRVYRI